MAITMRRLYKEAKAGTLAHVEDLVSLREELVAEIQKATKECMDHITRTYNEIQAEITRIDESIVTKTTLKEKTDQVLEDAFAHTKEKVAPLDEARKKLDALSKKEEVLEADVKGLHQEITDTEQKMNAASTDEFQRVRKDLDTRMADQRKQLAEAMSRQKAQLERMIEASWQDAVADSREARDMASSGMGTVAEKILRFEAEQREKNSTAIAVINEHLKEFDRRLDETKSVIDGPIQNQFRHTERQLDVIRDAHAAACSRIDTLNEEALALSESIDEAHNTCTRKADWVIAEAAKRVRSQPKPANFFSPKFCIGSERNLQLELQVLKPCEPAALGEECGDCCLNLWAAKGVRIAFRFCIGEISTPVIDHEFNGWEPCRSRRSWFFDEHLNQEEDSIRLGIELLEIWRHVEMPRRALPLPPWNPHPFAKPHVKHRDSASTEPRDEQSVIGTIFYHRSVNNRITEVVETAVNQMRSYQVRRVEWRLDQASTLRACFPEGRALCSSPFTAAGVENMQFVFYPSGCTGVQKGFCSLFYRRPPHNSSVKTTESMLKAWLRVGKQRWEAPQADENLNLYGKTHFCKFENLLDGNDDALQLVLEVQEAIPEVLEVGAQQDSWRSVPSRPLGNPSSKAGKLNQLRIVDKNRKRQLPSVSSGEGASADLRSCSPSGMRANAGGEESRVSSAGSKARAPSGGKQPSPPPSAPSMPPVSAGGRRPPREGHSASHTPVSAASAAASPTELPIGAVKNKGSATGDAETPAGSRGRTSSRGAPSQKRPGDSPLARPQAPPQSLSAAAMEASRRVVGTGGIAQMTDPFSASGGSGGPTSVPPCGLAPVTDASSSDR